MTIDDCENVARKLGDILDEKDPIQEAYFFEVSSPGIDRKLKRDWHFEKAIDKNVDIKTFAPFRGSKAFTAKLLGYDHGELSLEMDGERVMLEKGKTASVRLTVEF